MFVQLWLTRYVTKEGTPVYELLLIDNNYLANDLKYLLFQKVNLASIINIYVVTSNYYKSYKRLGKQYLDLCLRFCSIFIDYSL